MEQSRIIGNIGFADYLAQWQMGATMANQAVSSIKNYLQTKDAPVAQWG